MHFKVWLWRSVNRRGEIAILLLSAGVIRLGLLGRLQLYIHPRYIVFTLVSIFKISAAESIHVKLL